MKKYLFTSLCLSSLLLSQEISTNNLFELSLEELMSINVTTVSQEEEKASESLAIVSVLTSTQLKQMGALNLYEALSFLPGIQINETYVGYSVLTFRGVTPGLYNNKALFMINGHPVHEKLFGSSHLEFIPLDMVDRVEVVRSPSSVLYGTNAISGVVNVITKQGKEFSNELVVRGGSNDHRYGSVNIYDTHISMSASYQKDNGYNFSGTKDDLGQNIDKSYQNDLSNVFLDMYWDTWRIQAAYYRSEKEKLGLTTNIQGGGINKYKSFYVDVNKAFRLGSGTLNIWLRYDNMDKNLETEKFPDPINGNPITVENRTQRYSGEIQYKNSINKDFKYILGVNYEYDKTDPLLFIDQTDGGIHPFSPFLKEYTTNNVAVYSEMKYSFSNKLTGVVGLRVEDNSDTDTALNPRLGLNYKYLPDSYLKILYSEAYRSPTFLEKYADSIGTLLGDEDLNREKIRTLELGIDSKLNKNNTIQVTIYYLKLEDEIIRRSTGNGTEVEYYNSDSLTNYGLEVSLNSILNEKSEFMINGSYVDGERKDNGDNKNIESVAHYTANLMYTYHINTKWSSTLSDQYVSKKDYTTNLGESGSLINYNLTNITVSYLNKPFEANLYLKNIFDEAYTYPEPVKNDIKEIPGGAGISAYLTMRYYF